MSQAITLYTNPMSRGRIVRWMLEELGLNYQTKILDYATSMKSAEYLAINPMGKVPALQHGTTIITETSAICAYLAETFKDAGLAPQNDAERGAYYRWLFFAAGPLEQAFNLKMLGTEITPDNEKFLGCGNPQTTIDVLANALSNNTYICGERFTAADVYVGSHIGFGMQFNTLEKRPEFIKYWELLNNRPAKLKANQIDDSLMNK